MSGVPLIYILGVGRSGSTLVERMLASIPGAAAMGEVHSLWRLPLADLTCSCGAPGPDCPVWRETLALARIGDTRLAEMRELEIRAIRHRRIARRGFSLKSYSADADVQRFNKIQEALFTAFGEASGASLLIDSSKAAPRAWALALRPETRILHLSRNPAAVAKSWKARKHDPSLSGPMEARGAAQRTRERIIANLSFNLLRRRTGVARMRYERLVADPQRAMRAALGPGLTGAIAWQGERSFAPDRNYHSLNGNPDRFSRGHIAIEDRSVAPPEIDATREAAA